VVVHGALLVQTGTVDEVQTSSELVQTGAVVELVQSLQTAVVELVHTGATVVVCATQPVVVPQPSASAICRTTGTKIFVSFA
jgi:hypothetical protein